MILTFRVYGVAVPKGNMRPLMVKLKATGMKVPILTESNRNVKSWSQLVAHAANEALGQVPDAEELTEAVRLSVAFYLPRPKSLGKKSLPHLKAPDLDKLVRAVKDALTHVVYADDSQVVEVLATKQYTGDEPPHVDIRVEPTRGCEAIAVPPAPTPLLEGLF